MDRFVAMQVFTRVVETGSFSKAAAALGITQPTATKAVAEAEARLGVRLLHRTTRGVAPTEIGARYYERCKLVALQLEQAEGVAHEDEVTAGTLRISTSVAFGRRVMAPLVLRYMRQHPEVQVELSADDRYVNLVEQGIDLAVRMGRLADSSLGASYLGLNPWVLAAAPSYLAERGTPEDPAALAAHDCLVYSSVQGDARWVLQGPAGAADTGGDTPADASVPVRGRLRSNNLSTLLAACQAGFGLAMLPRYVAREPLRAGRIVPVLPAYTVPPQEVHAVFPSPRLVPRKVTGFIAWLQQQMQGDWWERPLG